MVVTTLHVSLPFAVSWLDAAVAAMTQ